MITVRAEADRGQAGQGARRVGLAVENEALSVVALSVRSDLRVRQKIQMLAVGGKVNVGARRATGRAVGFRAAPHLLAILHHHRRVSLLSAIGEMGAVGAESEGALGISTAHDLIE